MVLASIVVPAREYEFNTNVATGPGPVLRTTGPDRLLRTRQFAPAAREPQVRLCLNRIRFRDDLLSVLLGHRTAAGGVTRFVRKARLWGADAPSGDRSPNVRGDAGDKAQMPVRSRFACASGGTPRSSQDERLSS